MIIKRQQAQALPATQKPSREEEVARAATQQTQPEEPIGPDDIQAGLASDRRRTDRRAGYRRIEDQELISRAHEEANAIRESAAEEGLQEGLHQAQGVVDDLNQAIADMLNAKEQALLSAADNLAAMAVEIAERIIKTEVSCDESLVMSLVRGTIAKVGREQKSILIKVNPVEAKLVKETMKVDSQLSNSVEVLVAEDASVDQGSCMIETQSGLIDARFSTQLEVLKRMLLTGGRF